MISREEVIVAETDEMKLPDLNKNDERQLPTEIGEKQLSQETKVPIAVWTLLFVSCFGVFMASVSTSALIIAFPVLLVELKMTINVMMWVLLVLLLMIGAVVPTAGKLGDIIGQSRVYIFGYWLFVVGSLGAGFVNKDYKGYDLIAARVVIGLGAALLFTNSSAILTNAFAPYNKVGLSQGIFQLSSAMGIVFGPLIGGGFAESDWRWIFWFNVPSGGLCALLAMLVVKDKQNESQKLKSNWEHIKSFDYLGSVSCCFSLILILIAMVQGVVTDPTLSSTGAIAGLIISGVFCGSIFVADQYYAKDPLIPPAIFANRTFSLTTACGTLMAFVRNSVTYNMIFFLQGPFGLDPLTAGENLIPYGCGMMVAGFTAGALTDKLGVRNMIVAGPLIVLAGCALLSVMDGDTSPAYVVCILFMTGMGVGLFQSPNSTVNMLSVTPDMRGVAAAIGMLTMTFCMMIGIVLTFSFVLHAMTAEELFALFIYGGKNSGVSMQGCLNALALDYYIVIACCAAASFLALFHPGDLNKYLRIQSLGRHGLRHFSAKERHTFRKLFNQHTNEFNDDDEEAFAAERDIENAANKIEKEIPISVEPLVIVPVIEKSNVIDKKALEEISL